MTTSGLLVAAVAVPVGLLARALRSKQEPLLPRWKPWRVPWGGFEIIVAFLVVEVVIPTLVRDALIGVGFFQHIYGPDFPMSKPKGVEDTHQHIAPADEVIRIKRLAEAASTLRE